ncbi:MAG: geranylgeranyl reductase family protein [Desulfurococcales archaeon]|nr:geranylgeranyl reductase family protein [Desulfurococcales archaeon]
MAKTLKYDVVIVGLGPAGSSLAYFLKDSGLKVAGIDLVDWDGLWGKPCGDAIGEHHFDETGLPKPEGEAMRNRVVGIDVYSPREDVKLRVKGYGYIIDRNAYGRGLVKAAMDKGVDVWLKTFVKRPLIEDGRLIGVEARGPNGEDLVFRGKVTVDATGTSSVIRRRLPREWPVNEKLKPTDANIAYRKIVDLDHEIEDYQYIRIYVNMSIAPGGYWWFFPEGPTSVNVGLGVQGGRGYPSPKQIFEEKLANRPELKGIVRVKADAGAMVPTRRPANTLAWDGFIGIGDNGFTVNPVHGGGMGYAMVAAKYASQAIVEAFEAGDFSRYGPLWKTNTLYMRSIGARQAALDIFRIYLQTLTDEEIEWGLKNGVVKADDAYVISSEGELKANLSVLDTAKVLARMLKRPSMLLQLRTVGNYMKKAKNLYLSYPESPDKLGEWVSSVEELYKEFKGKLGIDW